jgi:tetratricopeptide (TPR) repeat protein
LLCLGNQVVKFFYSFIWVALFFVALFFVVVEGTAQDPAVLTQTGDAEYANKHYAQAVTAYEQAVNALSSRADPVPRADAELKLLKALLWSSDWGRCYKLSQSLMEAYDHHIAPDDPRLVSACNFSGLACERVGHTNEAESLYRRALAIQEVRFGKDASEVAGPLHNLALCVHGTGRYKEAEELYRRLLAINEKQYGVDDPRLAHEIDGIACMLNAQNKTQEALPYYRRSALIKEQEQFRRTHRPVNSLFYTSFYADALRKLAWTSDQISAELQSIANEAQSK